MIGIFFIPQSTGTTFISQSIVIFFIPQSIVVLFLLASVFPQLQINRYDENRPDSLKKKSGRRTGMENRSEL
jgi:uncharacterized membrane protein